MVLDKLRRLIISGPDEPAGTTSPDNSSGGGGLEEIFPTERLKVIFAPPLDFARDFVAPLVPKSDEERAFLERALEEHFLFGSLHQKEKTQMINAMDHTSVQKGRILMKQGDTGDYMYVIQSGTVRFTVDDQDEGTASKGAIVGELALLYDCPRAATVIAETDCVLYRVSQYSFRRVRQAFVIENDDEKRKTLRACSVFRDLDDEHIHKLAYSLFQQEFAKGDVLAAKGDESRTFYIIKEGFVKGTDISVGATQYADVRLGKGEFFGERSIVSGAPSAATVTALTKVKVWVLTSERFQRILGEFNLEELTRKSFDKKLLSAIPLIAYSDIDNIEIGLMSSKIQEAEYDKETVIAKIGASVAPGLYVIRSGTVSLSNDKGTKDLGAGEVFGFGGSTLILTNALKGENLTWQQHGFVALTTNAAAYLGERYLRANTVVAEHEAVVTENAKVGILTLESMNDVLYDVMRLGQDRKSTIDPSITKDNLVKMRILGAGTFGQVWLTRDDQTNSAYALKIQYKRELIEFGQVRGVIHEKQVMERMRHPFVMSIVNAQQDPTCLYMIMNLLQGGELRTQMRNRKRKCLTESSARFYAAGILEGLSYMHRRYYVYRDLKGENVLLDKDGYCVIVDLGFAKFVPDKTFTFCGTPVFIAPEVIMQTGHDKSADVWSFGVLLYEMVTGENPFYNYKDKNFSERDLFKRIMSGKFDFPEELASSLSPEVKDLIRKLLVVDVRKRLGCLARADLDIREHPWFQEAPTTVDFGKLYRKEITPPWVPPVSNPFDGVCFAKWDNKPKTDLKPLSEQENEKFADF